MEAHDGPRAFALGHLGEVDPDELGGAAADVDHEELLGPRADQRRAGDDGERASSSGWMISSARPVSRLTCWRNWAPFLALRQASVATSRMRLT
jgi:hypothetical protein